VRKRVNLFYNLLILCGLGKRIVTFLKSTNNAIMVFGGQNMPKSKKEKVAGLEKHRQLQRAKEMKRKQRKKIVLPTKHTKGKK